MRDAITVTIDSERLQRRLGAAPEKLRASIAAAMDKEAFTLQALVKDKLSGAVLQTRTGTLRRSINVANRDSGTTIGRSVGTNVRYGRAHEYGFDGIVNVREHTRTITQAFGRPISPRDVLVRAHTMHMQLPERSFLRSSLEERAPSIREALVQAIREALA